jgi:hypothetical protein
LIPNELKKSFNNLQQNIITRLEDRGPFKIIIEESATGMINEFNDFMQEMDIKVNFELT